MAILREQVLLADASKRVRGERYLGGLRRADQAGEGAAVGARVDPMHLLKAPGQHIDQPLVEVVAAQSGVAVARPHLHDPAVQLDDGDIEGAAAQVVDRDDLALVATVQPIGQGGRCRLVDDALYAEAGQLTGLACRLASSIGKVGGHRDDSALHRLPKLRLGAALQFL